MKVKTVKRQHVVRVCPPGWTNNINRLESYFQNGWLVVRVDHTKDREGNQFSDYIIEKEVEIEEDQFMR